MFTKTLPRGIEDFQLGKSLRHFRDLYDPKSWGEFKIELNRRESLASFVLRYPQQPKMPFRIVTADCPVSDDQQWLDEATALRMSFFYSTDVKHQLGDNGMLEHAIRKYGHSPQQSGTEAGFYKTYCWEDNKTRIELGLGHQYDRLQFLDATRLNWRQTPNQPDSKARPFGEIF